MKAELTGALSKSNTPSSNLGLEHFRAERDKAEFRERRATMRAYAIRYREEICPEAAVFDRLARRMNHAAKALLFAKFYRDLSMPGVYPKPPGPLF